MDKAIRYIYFAALMVGIVYMILAGLFGKNAVISRVEATKTQTVGPAETRILDDRTVEYILFFDEVSDEISMALEFFTSHQYVQVYAGEELIYSLYGEQSVFGHSTGSKINMVELPVQTESVRVVLQSVFGSVKKAPEFYYGDAVYIFHDIIKSSLLDSAMCLLIFSLGVCLIVYWLIMHRRLRQNPAIVYFGLFSVMIGLWTLNETDLVRLVYPNRMVGSLVAYLLLSFLVVPFVQFVRFFFEKEKSTLCNVICLASVLETVLLVCLHMSGVREFKQTAWMIHGMMFLGLGYMAFAVRERIRKYGMDRKVRVNAIAIFALLVSSMTDMVAYYTELQQTDVFGKLGFLIYIVLLGRESAADAFKKMQEGEKAQSYLKLAMTDVMTGLMNRSAFEAWEDKCTNLKDIMIVTFDLNNLKYCNDNLGHAAGDEYIVESANMIKRVFGSIGRCYRIGGDEFCAVVHRASRIDINKYLDRLRVEQDCYNRKPNPVKIHIAVGYAVHEETDCNMEETRSRADVCMYRNKKQLKENGER
jgi:diguanylate cyclase (GGDEF)-like protein